VVFDKDVNPAGCGSSQQRNHSDAMYDKNSSQDQVFKPTDDDCAKEAEKKF